VSTNVGKISSKSSVLELLVRTDRQTDMANIICAFCGSESFKVRAEILKLFTREKWAWQILDGHLTNQCQNETFKM
jgi:hypothetical protein